MMYILLTNILVAWYNSYVDDGVISEDESDDLYRTNLVIYCLVIGLSLPFIGIAGDKVPATAFFPFSFALRGLAGYCFLILTSPDSYGTIFLILWLGLGSTFEGIASNVVFYRKLPPEIRGMMMAGFTMSA